METSVLEIVQRRRPAICLLPDGLHGCLMCKDGTECMNHLYLQCEVALALWKKGFVQSDWKLRSIGLCIGSSYKF